MLPFIHLGPIKLPVYGLLLATAILLGVHLAARRAARHGLARDFVFSTAALAVLAGLVGAKLLDWMLHYETYSLETLISGAGTFLGGFLLGFAATAIAAWRARASLWKVGDTFAVSLALGVMLVRVGCFAASCDYGKPTDLPWGVVFSSQVAADFTGVPLGVRLHPSQLYESALGMLILITLLILERKPRPAGFLILSFVTLYAAGRFLLEFLRGDVDRGFFGPLSTSQWLSLVMVALFYGFYLRRTREPSEQRQRRDPGDHQRTRTR